MICSTEEVKGEMNADVEAPVISSIEENIRMDHDDLQEENKRVLAKNIVPHLFKVQKFDTSFEDLQAELAELKENKRQVVTLGKELGISATKNCQTRNSVYKIPSSPFLLGVESENVWSKVPSYGGSEVQIGK